MARRPSGFSVKRIKFNHPGFNEVRKAPALVADLEARGEKIAEAARSVGGEFRVIVTENKQRARVIVTAVDIQARAGEAKDRRLTNALSAGRS